MVKATIGVGIQADAMLVTVVPMRRGRNTSGARIRRDKSVDSQILPKMEVEAWLTAARTISRDGAAGPAFRWKYHCETVAAVVALWTALMTESVHRYMKTNAAPSPQLDISMTKRGGDFER